MMSLGGDINDNVLNDTDPTGMLASGTAFRRKRQLRMLSPRLFIKVDI